VLGDGIFSADSHNWYTQRKTSANMFKISNFKSSMLTAVRSKTHELLRVLTARLEGGDAVTVNLQVGDTATDGCRYFGT
jgi:hypothetical protein